MPEFTVLEAEHKKAVDGKHGPMQVIALRLNDGDRDHDAEWFTKATTDVPQSGTRLEGTLEAGQYGLRFKKAYNAPGGGGRSPKDTASIVRQHSQHMSLLLLQAKAQAGLLTAEELTPAKIKSLTDFFDDDVAAGVERKHPTPGMVRGLPVRNEPVRTGAPDIPIEPYHVEQDAGDVPWGQENT